MGHTIATINRTDEVVIITTQQSDNRALAEGHHYANNILRWGDFHVTVDQAEDTIIKITRC